MLRFFSMFGRSAALTALDTALRDHGVHPLLVPEAVKLTMLRLDARRASSGGTPGERAQGEAAELIAYCLLGPAQFGDSNGAAAARRAEDRFEAALADDDSPDARLILLALHAGLTAPEISDRVDVEDR